MPAQQRAKLQKKKKNPSQGNAYMYNLHTSITIQVENKIKQTKAMQDTFHVNEWMQSGETE